MPQGIFAVLISWKRQWRDAPGRAFREPAPKSYLAVAPWASQAVIITFGNEGRGDFPGSAGFRRNPQPDGRVALGW